MGWVRRVFAESRLGIRKIKAKELTVAYHEASRRTWISAFFTEFEAIEGKQNGEHS